MNEDIVTTTRNTVVSLGEARQRWVSAYLRRSRAEQLLEIAEAGASEDIITNAGGVKALGPNAAAQARAILVQLSDNSEYQQAVEAASAAIEYEMRCKQALATWSDILKVCLAIMENRNGMGQ